MTAQFTGTPITHGGAVSPATAGSSSGVRMAGDALLTIGTRGSPLALAQAYETRRRLGEEFDEMKEEGAVAIQVTVLSPPVGGVGVCFACVKTEFIVYSSTGIDLVIILVLLYQGSGETFLCGMCVVDNHVDE